MKGRIASRAHSFKEGLLEAFGHHSHHNHGHHGGGVAAAAHHERASATASDPDGVKSGIQLAKKTSSTDNLIGYTDPKNSTEGLVRDVQLALNYFEDAVSKGTYEMLPGCASVVLERIAAVQSYTLYQTKLKGDERTVAAMNQLYAAIANLTRWADTVIVRGGGGKVDWTAMGEEECRREVIEPVRKAVKAVTGRINGESDGQRRNSVPDLVDAAAIGEGGAPDGHGARTKRCPHGSSKRSSRSSQKRTRTGSTSAASSGKKPHSKGKSSSSPPPPPLPPKNLTLRAPPPLPDWFSNPLFEQQQQKHRHHPSPAVNGNGAVVAAPGPTETIPPYDPHIDVQLPSPHGLDTTLPDTAAAATQFPFFDESDTTSTTLGRTGSDEAPPSPLPELPKREPVRKKSQYDNVSEDEGLGTGLSVPATPAATAAAPPSPFASKRNPLHRHIFRGLISSQSFDFPAAVENTMMSPMMGPGGGGSGVGPGGGNSAAPTSRRNSIGGDAQKPPPLPPKRRDIINYMEVLGQSVMPSREDFMKNLAHAQKLLENVWMNNYHEFGEFNPDNTAFNFPVTQDLFTRNIDLSALSVEDSVVPPVLPPKKNQSSLLRKQQQHQIAAAGNPPPAAVRPLSPPTAFQTGDASLSRRPPTKERIIPILRESDGALLIPNNDDAASGSSVVQHHVDVEAGVGVGEEGEVTSTADDSSRKSSSSRHHHHYHQHHHQHRRHSTHKKKKRKRRASSGDKSKDRPEYASHSRMTPPPDDSPLNRLDFTTTACDSHNYVSNAEGILEVRTGTVDELIILAAHSTSKDFVYQDAFLLTYRTFVDLLRLLGKLEYRFRRFNGADHGALELKAARSSFSLIVRVVDTMIDSDFHATDVMQNLSDFIVELVTEGELLLARALRMKFVQKYEDHRTRQLPDLDFGRLALNSNGKPPSLLSFKSSDLAEQITLLDAQHFWKLEPTELLIWVKEQNEEKSPNLVRFTKHFNAMSFWCRTRILQEDDPKERERLVLKFVKVMKFLRKLNNFNSYLAFLSALDSASIRRLDWPKAITDTIKEYSAIIDFTGSFKAYRDALNRSRPPAIPYMGLVLQDLTFVHIGNSDFASKDKVVNFAKRWQQYNILDNVRRFKRTPYSFQRREDILRCFGNFEDALGENELWDLSEKIRPRPRSSPVKQSQEGGGSGSDNS